MLDEIWQEPTAVGLLLDVDRREITAARRGEIARHHCVLLDTGRRETAAAMRDGVKQLLLGLGSEKSLLLDVRLREITAAGRGIARNDCCWMPNMDKSLLLDEGRRETNTAAGRVTARNHYCCGVGRTARNHS